MADDDKETTSIRVWDVPVRLFHWSLVILVSVSLYTGLFGGFNEMDYHMLSGYALLALVSFRIIWGLIGSEYARFTQFLRPTEIVSYLKSLRGSGYKPSIGHNPMGALSVLAFLIVILGQATTGLFANDDLFMEGPLTHLVSDELSDELTSIHHLLAEVLYVLIGLHLTAIAAYAIFKKENLVLAMITGKKRLKDQIPATDIKAPKPLKEIALALVAIGITGGATYYIVNYL